MIDYKLLGNRIRVIRKANNLTQSELANALNVNHQFISAIETGRKRPSLLFLDNLSLHLNTTISNLLLNTQYSIVYQVDLSSDDEVDGEV